MLGAPSSLAARRGDGGGACSAAREAVERVVADAARGRAAAPASHSAAHGRARRRPRRAAGSGPRASRTTTAARAAERAGDRAAGRQVAEQPGGRQHARGARPDERDDGSCRQRRGRSRGRRDDRAARELAPARRGRPGAPRAARVARAGGRTRSPPTPDRRPGAGASSPSALVEQVLERRAGCPRSSSTPSSGRSTMPARLTHSATSVATDP